MYIQARIENKLIHNENELQFLFKCYMVLHYIISMSLSVMSVLVNNYELTILFVSMGTALTLISTSKKHTL